MKLLRLQKLMMQTIFLWSLQYYSTNNCKNYIIFTTKVYSKVNFSCEINNQNIKACMKSNQNKVLNEHMWKKQTPLLLLFNPILDGLFWGCSRKGGQKGPLPKICHTYSTMMKLGPVIPYLKEIQKIYEPRDTLPDFCWHQHFFTGNQKILLYQEIQIQIPF